MLEILMFFLPLILALIIPVMAVYAIKAKRLQGSDEDFIVCYIGVITRSLMDGEKISVILLICWMFIGFLSLLLFLNYL